MKINLHIGHTKTGTSQFQYLMTQSKEKLKEIGVLYPEQGIKFNAHHGLVQLLISQPSPSAGDPTSSAERSRLRTSPGL